ncbi:hypothetical protein SS50377_24493 [Spironucleus salmonicida]|uniref:Transmembrane protein n=1 Tax=Spironucleus salmonicida TaxID=348837 RepID=A0A9P8RZ58_9EUKA|nr:hypothetical protein SS50377_24493 [Spironucleus salmonicida]
MIQFNRYSDCQILCRIGSCENLNYFFQCEQLKERYRIDRVQNICLNQFPVVYLNITQFVTAKDCLPVDNFDKTYLFYSLCYIFCISGIMFAMFHLRKKSYFYQQEGETQK